jgi:hypothetical protein
LDGAGLTSCQPIGERQDAAAGRLPSNDPDGLFFVHHGVGSEAWSDDGFKRA